MNTNVKSQNTAEWQDDDSNCLKIPVIVGVSGHIDILTPEAEIEKQMHISWHALQNLVGPETRSYCFLRLRREQIIWR